MTPRAAPRMRRRGHIDVEGSLWLTAGGHSLAGHNRIELLRAIAETGSITQAAKAFGMSYKGAWDAVDAMNRASGEPLVERVSGGRGGGGTRLTDHGTRLIARYAELDAAHRRFVALLADAADLAHDFSALKVLNMKTSARNQLVGTISAVRSGAVNDEVELALPSGQRVVATITHESTATLGLRTGQQAIALIKASSVLLATDLGNAKVSTRNTWPGVVAAVTAGAVNAEVALDLDGGGRIVSIVTGASAQALGLAVAGRATALVKASDVILAVAA